MADPGEAFHVAQDAALRGSDELAALWPGGVARIYSVVPQNAPLPFVRIGDDQIIEDSDECLSGSEIFATVHVWTSPEPPDVQLGRRIAGVIRDALAADIGLNGFDTVLFAFVETRHLTDPDGTSHALLVFRYLVTDRAPIP